MLTESKFWQIIGLFDWSQDDEDDDAIMAPALKTLSKLSRDDLVLFDKILARKLYLLDTLQHARAMGFGVEHFSASAFLYVRCAVVARGKTAFHRVLNDPQEIATFKDHWFESLLYLAETAAETMGIDDYFDENEVSYETFSNEAGWKQDR